MPQFDPSSFASQAFWLLVMFAILYAVVSRYAIPRLGEVLDQRQRTVSDDLERAHALKAETEAAIAVYEKALASARAESHTLIGKAKEEIQAKADAEGKAVAARLGAQVKEGEQRIAAARDKALHDVRGVAGEVATLAVDRLAGVTLDSAVVDDAVATVLKGAA